MSTRLLYYTNRVIFLQNLTFYFICRFVESPNCYLHYNHRFKIAEEKTYTCCKYETFLCYHYTHGEVI